MKKLITVVISAIIVIFVILSSNTTNLAAEDTKSQMGVMQIKEVENYKIASIQKTIDDYEKTLEEKQETPKKTEKVIDFKKFFKNDIFLGDSQSEGLNLYGFLNDSSVVAKKGQNLNGAINNVSTIKNLAPQNIYILFGLNDLIIFRDLSQLETAYENLILKLKEEVPDATIHVNSMLQARNDAISKQPLLSIQRNIDGNKLIEQMCEDNDVEYIDITYIFKENPSLYEADGMHCKAAFYKVWLSKLMSMR